MNAYTLKNDSYISSVFTFLLLLALITSCDRNTLELPESTGGPGGDDPLFGLEMIFDNTPISVLAGVADIFNHTDLDSDQNEIYTFSGSLAPVNCNVDCPNSFTMQLRNFETGISGFNLEQSVGPRSYAFKSDVQPVYDALKVDLNIISDIPSARYTWEIDSNFFTQEIPNDIRIINDEGTISGIRTRLTVLDEDTGLSSFMVRKLEVDENIDRISPTIQIEQIEADSVVIRVVHSMTSFFTPIGVIWGIEDLDGKNKMSVTLRADQELRLRLGEGKDIKSTTQFQALVGLEGTFTGTGTQIRYDENEGLIYHNAEFDYEIIERIEDGSALDLQTFEFIYVDEDGTTFSTAKGEQPKTSLFEIQSVEPFLENSRGQETVKIDCQFSCTLFADDGTQRIIQNAQATIALAIP